MGKLRKRRGFTLVELLVVIAIILLLTVATIPTVVNSVNQNKITEAARIVQAAFVGAGDRAIRTNQPSGVRLLPSVTLTLPAMGSGSAPGTQQLAYDRMIEIEPAADYAEGKVSIAPMLGGGVTPPGTFPTIYPNVNNGYYPYPDQNSGLQQVLMIEEAPYVGGYLVGTTAIPNSPTSWYWNIRIGDKLKINNSGISYTVVGPCTVNPITVNGQNPELFVNIGPPGTAPPVARTYYDTLAGGNKMGTHNPEFLFLVNGTDDDGDGYIDEGFDGFNQDYNIVPDTVADQVVSGTSPNISEWESEKWKGTLENVILADPDGMSTDTPSFTWVGLNSQKATQDLAYTIKRRPVPTRGARETKIPGGIVIDATTWNTTQERSRFHVDPYSLYVDFMVNADGQVLPQTIYSTPTAFSEPFYHLWLTSSTDVFSPTVNSNVPYTLPMPAGSPSYPAAGDTSGLKLTGDRRLISVFLKSGLITSDTIENFDASGTLPFNAMAPFLDAQLGMQSAK
ncbi:pilus assembly FimT family protein [Singulisphaera sp. PoT]|uniref:pilus assembly FimT family protein n=1 Tax=Singulisphaera sp. PoT TaxID=3411797 RepID=UPI003BF4AF6A